MGEARIVVAHLGAGHYEARLDGRLLCVAREPFLEAARVLLAEGMDPETRIGMWRVEDSYPSLTAKLRVAAKLDVKEDPTPRFVRHRPAVGEAAPSCPDASPAAVCDLVGVREPETEMAAWGQG